MLNFIKKYQEKQQRRQRGKIMFFSMFSAVISGMAAIFLTPKSGKEMRDVAQKEAQTTSTKIQEVAKEAQQKVSDASEVIADKSKTVIDKIRTSFSKSVDTNEVQVDVVDPEDK
jgi:gas vesicle protein